MAGEYERVCVAWKDPVTKAEGWCAVAGKLDPMAVSDTTVCGYQVSFRGKSERRQPTCPECLAVLRRKKAARQKRYKAGRRKRGG